MTFGPLCEILNASIYVSTSKLISWRNCCVDLLCTIAVVSVFCTGCRSDFAFPVFCHDHQEVVEILRFLLQVVLENQNGKICFCDSSQNVYVSVGCPWFWYHVHFQMLMEISLLLYICQWKHKQHHLNLCQFLEHHLPTPSNGHGVILPSGIHFYHIICYMA